ncbi:MAG: NBR1-Ig-like domain-containing protein [Anaerolineales bacterium]|nr:NBR1-Ig-like domain-containing protein [Anaerolineales bacterium]
MISKKKNQRNKKKNKVTAFYPLLAVIFLVLFSGCANQQKNVETTATVQPFVPPGSHPATAALSTPDQGPAPTVKSDCNNQLDFVEDLTIPDGTSVTTGEQVTKQWLVENSGTCDWNREYSLRFVSGDPLNAPVKIQLFPARRGSQAVIQITFTAPESSGSYVTMWQAFDPRGDRFGDPFYMEINVEEDQS